jgi:hypothetical protein
VCALSITGIEVSSAKSLSLDFTPVIMGKATP